VQVVPSIGALNDLNVEALVALHPELVLVSGTSRAISERLSRLGLRFEAVPDVALSDLYTGITQIGALTARVQTARQLVDSVRADLEAITARYAQQPPARVLLLTAPLPNPPARLDAAGPGSFYDDLLRMAGHTNVVPAGSAAFTSLALEFVLRAAPEVIIELAPDRSARRDGDADALRAWSVLGALPAVAHRRVHVVIGEQYFVLGPRIAQTLEALCAAIAEDRYE
jgi:iron complex transport system substrate-binding protein